MAHKNWKRTLEDELKLYNEGEPVELVDVYWESLVHALKELKLNKLAKRVHEDGEPA